MIGLITFHAAYNFGSSLQAYATQKTIKKLGYDNEIINYRLNNQIHYYGDLITLQFGKKEFLRRLLCLPEVRARKARAKRYEAFIKRYLKISKGEYHTFKELSEADLKYDILVAGSDQVWNEHCTAEFKTEPPDSILAYFLDFDKDPKTKRISFSSSLGFMKEEEVRKYIPQLRRFRHLALREKDGAEMIGKILGVKTSNTVDPTMLLTRDEWINDFKVGTRGTKPHYVLMYSLEKSPRKMIKIQKRVRDFAGGRKVICLSPFLSTHIKGIHMRNDAGPIEFLSLLIGADCMVTDSFHGTAFSVNLGIPFYTINTGRDHRKQLLLNRVGLEDQLIASADSLAGRDIPSFDFHPAWDKLKAIRDESVDYLKNALET